MKYNKLQNLLKHLGNKGLLREKILIFPIEDTSSVKQVGKSALLYIEDLYALSIEPRNWCVPLNLHNHAIDMHSVL